VLSEVEASRRDKAVQHNRQNHQTIPAISLPQNTLSISTNVPTSPHQKPLDVTSSASAAALPRRCMGTIINPETASAHWWLVFLKVEDYVWLHAVSSFMEGVSFGRA